LTLNKTELYGGLTIFCICLIGVGRVTIMDYDSLILRASSSAVTWWWFFTIDKNVTKLSNRLNLSSSSKFTIVLENLRTFEIGISSSSFPVIHGCYSAYSTRYRDPGFKLQSYSIKFFANGGISTELSIFNPLNSFIF